MKEIKYIRYVTFLAAFGALAYLSVVFLKIPMVAFLKYEPKDVILVLGGMLLGPIFAIILSVLVPFFEMITVSSTGIIGFIMNVIAAICFVLPPVLAYRKNRKTLSLLIGLVIGTVVLTVAMLLWNYFLAPVFFGYSQETVVKMLVPIVLPFNLIKGGLNAFFILVLYKPIFTALFRVNIVTKDDLQAIPNESRLVYAILGVMAGLTVLALVLTYFKVF